MIGKIFRAFSNDWKQISAQGERKGCARGKRKELKGGDAKNAKAGAGGAWGECGRRDATRISRMPLRGLEGLVGDKIYIEKRENRFADLERCRDEGGAPAEMIGKNHSPIHNVGGTSISSVSRIRRSSRS